MESLHAAKQLGCNTGSRASRRLAAHLLTLSSTCRKNSRFSSNDAPGLNSTSNASQSCRAMYLSAWRSSQCSKPVSCTSAAVRGSFGRRTVASASCTPLATACAVQCVVTPADVMYVASIWRCVLHGTAKQAETM